jgi:hypothetical protein
MGDRNGRPRCPNFELSQCPLAPAQIGGRFFLRTLPATHQHQAARRRVVGDETSALRPVKDVAAPGCKIPLARTRTASGYFFAFVSGFFFASSAVGGGALLLAPFCTCSMWASPV